MTNTPTPVANQPESIIEVTNIDHMVRILVEWNKEQVALLRHMIDMPEGTQVDIEKDNSIALTGDVRRAFQLGIQLSIEELGNLPFTVDNNEVIH